MNSKISVVRIGMKHNLIIAVQVNRCRDRASAFGWLSLRGGLWHLMGLAWKLRMGRTITYWFSLNIIRKQERMIISVSRAYVTPWYPLFSLTNSPKLKTRVISNEKENLFITKWSFYLLSVECLLIKTKSNVGSLYLSHPASAFLLRNSFIEKHKSISTHSLATFPTV